jgi:hypothetical protein
VVAAPPRVRAPPPQQQPVDGEDAKRLALKSREELLKKLCYVCEKPNCSQYCFGFCRRAFHELCRDYLEKNPLWVNVEGAPSQNVPWELTSAIPALNIKY